MTTLLETLMAATVKIGGPKPGTGYLIAPNRIATCHHVIDLWEPAEKHEVKIGFPKSIAREACVIKSDQKTDCAILGFEEPVTTTPLTIGDPLEVQTYWEGYGFPHSAGGDGLYFKGEVLIPKTEDQTGREVIQLYSPMAGSGAATPLHGFSGTPILVSGVVVGHMIRHVGDPDDLKRPAFGMIYAAPIRGVEAILDVKPAKRHVDPPKLTEAKGFVEEMRKSGAQQARELDAPKDATLASAKILIGQNRPDLALELLGSVPDAGTLQSKQMYALALAKAGKTKESIARLRELINNGADDHETLGLLAGRYKDSWRQTGNVAALRAAYETYRDTFQKTNDSFNGINAAATALYCGERVASAILAEKVSTLFEDAKDLNHWNLATVGEAWLLQGKLDRRAGMVSKGSC